MKTQILRFGFFVAFLFSSLGAYAQAIIGGPVTLPEDACTDCWRMNAPINFYQDADSWTERWESWDWYIRKGVAPANNYLAQGVVADITIAVQPASQCSRSVWNLSAMKYIQYGRGAVQVQNAPTEFSPVAGIDWFDFVDTSESDIVFWRNRQVRPEWCDEKGSRVLALLSIRQTPEPVSLERIEWGSTWGDPWVNGDYNRGTGLGGYGLGNQGYRYGSDGRKGTSDDSSVRSGPDYQPVDELYSLGFFTSRKVHYSSELYDSRDHYGTCQIYTFWYRVWGAVTGKLLAELRVDVPVGYVPPISFEVVRKFPGGGLFLDFQAYGNVQGVLETATDPRGPWHRQFDYPIWPGLYPVQIGTVPVYQNGKLVGRIPEPSRFFRISSGL